MRPVQVTPRIWSVQTSIFYINIDVVSDYLLDYPMQMLITQIF
jgi:hypothetical protein